MLRRNRALAIIVTGMLHVVTEADTAQNVGSGDVPVLATPRLLTWMEATTVVAAAPLLSEGQTSVGTSVRVEHLRATPVGGHVDVHARRTTSAGETTLTFEVNATDGGGRRVAEGVIVRAIVDRARFLARLQND